jgi:hypothetical protein
MIVIPQPDKGLMPEASLGDSQGVQKLGETGAQIKRFFLKCPLYVEGRNQIGDDHALSWMVAGRSARGATPARIASQVDHRQDGFSRART